MIKYIFLLFCAVFSNVHADEIPMIKQSNVAGAFYPDDAKALSQMIDAFISQAIVVRQDSRAQIVIAPHAGYVYSGPVAGHAFNAIAKNKYSTIIVIAPSHYYPFEATAIWPKGGFQTPLGIVPIDEEFSSKLLNQSRVVKELKDVFNQEHALEVELPFIQKTFPESKIVALLMGQPNFQNSEQLAMDLNAVIGSREDVLVLISSDMSHYHPYEKANAMDAVTLEAIKNQDIEAFWHGNIERRIEMCGFVPVTVGMMLAKLRGLTPQVIKYNNSGDTAGDKSKVVGYGAVVYAQEDRLSGQQRQFLLTLARQAVDEFVRLGKKVDVKITDARLGRVQGAFVTLHKNGQLRGCIGNIIGQKSLAETVNDMALAAASQDPRFDPVTPQELKDITIEISALSVPKRIKNADEIVLGRDGVIISDGGSRQGVFLPQVAIETGWSKEEFLSQLCAQKAGLKPNAWKDPNIQLYTFTAEVFAEEGM